MFKKTVAALIAQRLEPTVALALSTIFFAVLVAVPLGVLAAWRHGGWLDRALMGFSTLGFSIPVFVLGYLLIWLVSIKLGWLPVQGYRRLVQGVLSVHPALDPAEHHVVGRLHRLDCAR